MTQKKSSASASPDRRAGRLPAYKDERIAHLVRLCARGFSRSLSRRLADQGVSFGQWVFLRILWKQEGLTQRELSELANLTEPTVHTALSKLEKMDIIVRRTQGGNKRKYHVYLTKKGRDLQSTLEPLAVEANDSALRGLSAKKQDQLRDMLVQILNNLADDEAEAEALGLKVPPTRNAAV
ncbi:MarR family winged helix-turn-helix transcriptional regulator [Microbaculum marinisediminis]|uniref:MarR family transcriptional regulator n=1 Tax=Microbaculum marinisediminis TaxID=2931392 RepID=A0AAW5R5M4_9HYPH|nr:MarR family transcriptional regulator [Microbaculum sp. A6E488]MCT8973978.1 MarR family transcriptional regulator [Microbaculum sp. A6E488]